MKNATCLVTSKHQRHEELLGSSAATSSFTFKLAANEATQPDQVAHVLSDKPRHRKGPHRTVAPASPAKQRPLEVAPNAMPPIIAHPCCVPAPPRRFRRWHASRSDLRPRARRMDLEVRTKDRHLRPSLRPLTRQAARSMTRPAATRGNSSSG